jgi:DNA-binding CsgD family transcriptional regulator
MSLGRDDFADALMDHLRTTTQVDHLAIFRFNEHFVPELLGTASRGRSTIAREAGKLYQRQRYYRHDPGARQVESQPNAAGPLLFRLHERDIRDRDYHERIYVRYKLLERMSVIGRVEQTWMAVNLYRTVISGVFSSSELASLQSMAPTVLAFAGKHAELLKGAVTKTEASPLDGLYVQLLSSELSARERAVCAGALRGLSAKRIAIELGVKPSTVVTLRRRAFRKLDIATTTELFIRCIAALTKHHVS